MEKKISNLIEFPSRPSTARQNCKDSLLVFKCFSTIRMYLKAVIQVKRNVDHWANMIQIPLLPTINLRKNPHLRNSKNKMHLPSTTPTITTTITTTTKTQVAWPSSMLLFLHFVDEKPCCYI